MFVGLTGPLAGKGIPIPAEGLYIGRDTIPELRRDKFVSGEHALIWWIPDGRLLIEDRHSRHGTYVNNGRVEGPTIIGAGDQIVIGQGIYEIRIARRGAVASHGAVAAGGGATTIHGDMSASYGGVTAGDIRGDVNTGDYYDVTVDPYGLDDVSGFPRFLMILGIFVALAGFAFFGYPIVMGLIAGADASAAHALCDQQFGPTTQENFNCHFNVNSGITFQIAPWIPIGAALMFVGMVLTIVARALKRNDEPRRRERGV
jgi:hypothetical protein